MKMLETIHILPVRAESAAPAPLRGKKLDQRAVLQVVRKVDWKKAGLIAGGVTVVCAAVSMPSKIAFTCASVTYTVIMLHRKGLCRCCLAGRER